MGKGCGGGGLEENSGSKVLAGRNQPSLENGGGNGLQKSPMALRSCKAVGQIDNSQVGLEALNPPYRTPAV